MTARSAGRAIDPVRYLNPAFPRLEIEAFTLSELRRRAPHAHLDQPQRPDFHLLTLFTSGRTVHYVDFERYECRPGTVLHVRPGQVQQFALQTGVEGQMLLFTPGFVLPEHAADNLDSLGALMDRAVPAVTLDLNHEDHRRIRDGFNALHGEYRATDGSALSMRVLQHLLHALLLGLLRISAGSHPETDAPQRAYRRFVTEVEANFAKTRRVDDYARKLGYSAKTLGRACVSAAGMSPKQFIEHRVALEAKRLLAHTQLPVGTIATELGFTETTNFVKFFRKTERALPTEFRARYPGLPRRR